MNDLTFLFFLIPVLMVPTTLLALWLVMRQQRQIQRDVFGEQNVPLFAAFFPTSGAGLRYHAQQYGASGSHQGAHGGSSSWGHGDAFSSAGHGSSHDHGSHHDHGSYDSGCSGDSGSSGSSDSGSSCSSGSDSGSSSW